MFKYGAISLELNNKVECVGRIVMLHYINKLRKNFRKIMRLKLSVHILQLIVSRF